MKKKLIGLVVVLGLVAAGAIGGYAYYQKNMSPTHVAFVNFMDFQYDKFLEVNDNPYIEIDRLSLGEEEFPDIRGYDAVYFFAHGNVNLNDQQRETIEAGKESGVKIYFFAPTAAEDLSNLTEEETEFIQASLRNGGTKNLRGVLNYSRRVFDGKTSHTDEIEEPFVYPSTYYYHLGEEEVFESLEDYESFYKEAGRYTEGGAKVALVSQILGMQSGSGFLKPLIESLEGRGMNVYPVSGFRGRMDLLKAVDPDLMVFIPHGRLSGTQGVDWLKEANIPMLSPLVVFAPHDEWDKSQQGMDGGMLSQNIVMAELDGGVVPYTIAAQFENDRGLMLFEGLEDRIEKFTGLAERWIKLQTAENKDKKVVVFYYKGAGKNAMVAEGLELAPSLFNLLKRLNEEGYETGPLPADADALYERIQAEGPVIGSYAKGALEDYYANGNPALVPAGTFREWIQKWIPVDLLSSIEEEYGPAPGYYMNTVKDGEAQLVVSRVQFGNVVLMPVPPAGYGDNDVQLVHGVKKAPPYPYIGGYLWAKEGFKADAIIHFGTHGSVEFTPWKQVALSDYDWPDILTSGVPHFYLYSMSNIGEALVAKRRTYATMTTHLTPPFMASGIYDDIQRLHQALDRYWSVEDPLLKERYLQTVRELVVTLDMDKDLSIEDIDNVELTKEKLLEFHTHMHELEQAKVAKGLHVLGRPYSEEDTFETVRLIAIDYLSYTMAQLDQLNGKITKEEAEDDHLILEMYREPALKMIDAIYQGEAQPEEFFTVSDTEAMTIHKPVTIGHTHADGTTHTHTVGEGKDTHGHGGSHTHADGTTHSHDDGSAHSHDHGDGHSHSHPHDGDHEHIGAHDGMLATLRDPDGKSVGQIELKLHDDKGDLELWLFEKDGKSPYELAADTPITVTFESVDGNEAKNDTTVTLAVRNMEQNEDEDGVANMREGGQTNYFIFPGETGADASWLQGKDFKADVLVSFKIGEDRYRTDAFTLIPHTHSDGHGHGHGDHAAHGHPHHGGHEDIDVHDGMLATLNAADGQPVGQIELKLHDDKGDLELWLFGQDGKSPYDLAADTAITVTFKSVESDEAKNGTSVTLAVRNKQLNEDEDGVANMRDGGQTNYFIFPGDTGADASWLQGKDFEAEVLVSFQKEDASYRTDTFSLIPHTHSGGHDHGHAHGGSQPEKAKAKAPHGGGGHGGQGSPHGGGHPYARPGAAPEEPADPAEQKRADLEETFRDTLESINTYRAGIEDSPKLELDAIVNGLAGGYVEPQTGGDPVVNPSAVPSGRNLIGIDAEKTPTIEAWDVAKQLVDQLIETKLAETGEYPKKVGFSLWSSEFVRQEGITIGEILYLLGVEPVRNRRGTVHDVRLIPAEELGRPRIDVIVQTSGQFRDLGASRIYLINQAVALAARAEGTDEFPNYVRDGAIAAETVMKEKGASPAEAKELATIRVFGGLNGNYGTGIMGMVESGDSWEEESQVADQYLNNMGAFYDKDRWGEFKPGMFEAALQNTDTVVHPRSSNTWGPLSLDHVYEFMGGMTLAIRHVTGEDPDSYFSDLRNPNKPVVQNAKKAIWVEARTTMLNPKYIAAMQEEGATAAENFAETFRNTYGWDVMQPTMIDEEIWDKYEEVYVQDKLDLDIREFFEEKNPYALQEMTAIMLETVRKGYWNPSEEVVDR
ncbi:MAG: cobaltochelatase subunit CobN, partial [Planctomycetota bacterium]